MDFDPNKKEDLDLLLMLFARLSPEQKDEMRAAMIEKYRQIGQKYLDDIGSYLTTNQN